MQCLLSRSRQSLSLSVSYKLPDDVVTLIIITLCYSKTLRPEDDNLFVLDFGHTLESPEELLKIPVT